MRIACVGSGRSVHVTGRSAALAARGHAVRLVTVGEVLPAEGIEVRTRPFPKTLPRSFSAARGFLGDLRSFRPDLLQLHYAGGKLGALALVSGLRPLAVTVVGGDVLPEQHPGPLSRWDRRTTREVLRTADLVLVKADTLRPALESFGPLAARVETVRWGVDPVRFHRDPAAAARLRARWGLTARDRVVLSPRILAALYNTHVIVEAMSAVLRREPEALLVVTEYNAEPLYRREVEGLALDAGIAHRVRLVGTVAAEEMPALYSLAEVAVSVPVSDGLPQSLFEALACETPVVLGRLPAYGEIVRDGESALFTDIEPEAVAEAILRLLGDAALRGRMRARGLARVREVGLLPREVARVERFYEELLAGARRRARPHPARLLDALGLLARRAY